MANDEAMPISPELERWFRAKSDFTSIMKKAGIPVENGFSFSSNTRDFTIESFWRLDDGGDFTPQQKADGVALKAPYDALKYLAGKDVADGLNFGLSFEWLLPNAQPGFFQVGETFLPCPDGTYTTEYGRVQENTTLRIPCKACSNCVYACQHCEKHTGSCKVNRGMCFAEVSTRPSGVDRSEYCFNQNGYDLLAVAKYGGNEMCKRCLPDSDQTRLLVDATATCDDGCVVFLGVATDSPARARPPSSPLTPALLSHFCFLSYRFFSCCAASRAPTTTAATRRASAWAP